MRKTVSVFLVCLLVLSICACGNNGGAYSIGQTVSTDIIDLTITDAKLAIALENTESMHYQPKTYNAASDKNNPYVASNGETLVSLSFTIKNNNRTTVDIGSAFSDWKLSWKIKYNGKNYDLLGPGYYVGDTQSYLALDKCCEFSGGEWKYRKSGNILLEAGKSITLATYGIIETDVNSLDDPFVLTVKVLNSKNKLEAFSYSVNAK